MRQSNVHIRSSKYDKLHTNLRGAVQFIPDSPWNDPTDTCTHKKGERFDTLVLQRMSGVSTPHTIYLLWCHHLFSSLHYLNTLLIYCLSNQQHKHQFSSYFINLQVTYIVWMENMCTSCSCSKHTCSLKALFLHIKGCDNLCLVGTLLSITCPLTEINLK